MSDDELYVKAEQEYDSDDRHHPTYLKAMTEAEGDEARAKFIYLRHRVAAFKIAEHKKRSNTKSQSTNRSGIHPPAYESQTPHTNPMRASRVRQPKHNGIALASIWERIIGYLIDSVIMLVPGGLLTALITDLLGLYDNRGEPLYQGPGMVVMGAYFAYSLSRVSGATLGMKAVGLRAVDDSGMSPTPGIVFGRHFLFALLNAFFLSSWWRVWFLGKDRPLHDEWTSISIVKSDSDTTQKCRRHLNEESLAEKTSKQQKSSSENGSKGDGDGKFWPQ